MYSRLLVPQQNAFAPARVFAGPGQGAGPVAWRLECAGSVMPGCLPVTLTGPRPNSIDGALLLLQQQRWSIDVVCEPVWSYAKSPDDTVITKTLIIRVVSHRISTLTFRNHDLKRNVRLP